MEGRKYKVEFFFQLSDYSKYSVDHIGVLLSDSSKQVPNDRVWAVEPSFTHVTDSVHSKNTEMWNQVSFEYSAKGGEQYISIGNFSPDEEIKKFHLQFSQANEPLLNKAAYF